MFKSIRTLCAAICVGVVFASVSGCALFGSELDKAAEAAGKLVTFYCDNIPNEAVREQFRTAVNEHAAPNAVNVTCANGSAPLAVPSTNTGAHVMPTTNPYEKARLEARNKAVAETAEAAKNAPPAPDNSKFDALSSRVDSLESIVSSHGSTLSSHESRIQSLERRTG